MRYLFALALVLMSSSRVCEAAIVFRVDGPSQVQQGSVGQFDIFISSNAGPAELNFLEFNAYAGAGDGTGGVFTASSTTFLLQGNNDEGLT